MATAGVYIAPSGSRRSARIHAAMNGPPANTRVSFRSGLQKDRDRVVCSLLRIIMLANHLVGITYE